MDIQEKTKRFFDLAKQAEDIKNEIELLLSCDRECCQKNTGRVYKKNEVNYTNIALFTTLSGTAQFDNHTTSTPILDITRAMGEVGGCDRVIMNKRVYKTLNLHPDFLHNFEETKKRGGALEKDPVSTVIYPEISIQDIENTIIIEKDGEPVCAIFQVMP